MEKERERGRERDMEKERERGRERMMSSVCETERERDDILKEKGEGKERVRKGKRDCENETLP